MLFELLFRKKHSSIHSKNNTISCEFDYAIVFPSFLIAFLNKTNNNNTNKSKIYIPSNLNFEQFKEKVFLLICFYYTYCFLEYSFFFFLYHCFFLLSVFILFLYHLIFLPLLPPPPFPSLRSYPPSLHYHLPLLFILYSLFPLSFSCHFVYYFHNLKLSSIFFN
jgi:hypothetical protein